MGMGMGDGDGVGWKSGEEEKKDDKNKKSSTLLDLCVSSLRRGHANLLCIVSILTDVPRKESKREVYLASICLHNLKVNFQAIYIENYALPVIV